MPLESWLAGVIDALCKTDNSGKAETEKKYRVNFCCVIQCGWDSGVLHRLEKMRLFPDSWSHFYAKGFFSQHCIRVKSSMHQDTSACIKGACIRPSTHQHAGSSHSSCNVVSIGVSGGLQAGVWYAPKGTPLWTAKEGGCHSALWCLGREHRYRLSL